MTREAPPEECAQCGATIPRNARACPQCGADERTGWREVSIYDGLDLPEDPETRPLPRHRNPGNLPWYWFAVGFALVLLLVLTVLGLR